MSWTATRMGGVILASASMLLTSCVAPDGPVGAAMSMVDSAGVRIVTTHRLEWDTVRILEEQPAAAFPGDRSSAALSRVRDAAVVGNRVAVLDSQEERVFLFSEAGEPEDTVGGPGQGPGEFRAAVSMTVADGNIHVFDRSLRRITQFAPDGTIRRLVSLQAPDFPGKQHVSYAWMVDADRVLVWEYVESEQAPVSSSGDAERWVTPGRLRLANLATSGVETLFRAPARDWIVEGSRWWVAPFGPYTTLSHANGRLYMSPGSSHAVHIIDPDSGWVASYRYPAADRPFDLRELARLEDEARVEASESGHPFMAEVLFSPDIQPPMQPAIQRVRVTGWGAVWAQVHAPAQHHSPDWWVLGADGRFRGIVRLPGRRELLGFDGDYAIMRSLDEFDVPTVELWRLPADLR
ncbi:MAG: 6-bladed beta-propeller [Gemmatimonadota bacterium]|nr:6-bladed beta-propeller [Gemmatimonadota bacterium]